MTAAAEGLERVTIKVPPGFDPKKHQSAVLRKVTEEHGDGFELETFDPATAVITAVRQSAMMQLRSRIGGRYLELDAPTTLKPSDGDKTATRMADLYPGYEMTKFEPLLGRVGLTKLTATESRCRQALAGALGVKPWDVQVADAPDGGFDVILPRTYSPSKHDKKLLEVAEMVVGHEGWYVDTDAKRLKARIVPADPPTFPAVLPTPLDRIASAGPDLFPLGRRLPEPGQDVGDELVVNWADSAFLLVGGVPKGGKELTLDTRVPVPVSDRFKDGWASVGDLEVGDRLFARDGSIVSITDLSPIRENVVYEVEFTDGQVVRTNAEHWWTASDRQMRRASSATATSPFSPTVRRGKVDARRAGELGRLQEIADRATEHKTGATAEAAAPILGLAPATVSAFASAAGLPYTIGPGKGGPLIYSLGELVSAWIRHRRTCHGAEAARRMPLEKVVTTAEIAASLRCNDGHSNWSVSLPDAVDGDQELEVPPYLFGAWLGDGHSDAGQVTVGDQDWGEMTRLLGQERPFTAVYDYRAGARTVRFGRLDGAESLTTTLRRIGVLNNKHIPAHYLRASAAHRLALLQGLMDTDGTIDERGKAEFSVMNPRLASDTLELVRSLGVRASMTSGPATVTRSDGTMETVGVWWRVTFKTDQPVFRLPRKAARIPAGTARQKSNFIVDVRRTESVAPMRCIRVNHPEHLFLVEGFIPTHNTQVIISAINHALTSGCELVVIDDEDKAADYLPFQKFCRRGGWGVADPQTRVAALALVNDEITRRARELVRRGLNNWLDMPAGERFAPIFVVVDELSLIVPKDPALRSLPKDNPMRIEVETNNIAKDLLLKALNDMVAKARFVGVRCVVASQILNDRTGAGPTLRGKFGNFLLLGASQPESSRVQVFANPKEIPYIPGNVVADSDASRGVGTASLWGEAPAVFKGYFRPTAELVANLERLGVPARDDVVPTAADIDRVMPTLDEDDAGSSRGRGGGERSPVSGRLASDIRAEMGDDWDVDPETGQQLRGFDRANAARHASKVVRDSEDSASDW